MYHLTRRIISRTSLYLQFTPCRVKVRFASETTVQLDRIADFLETDRTELTRDLKRHGILAKATMQEIQLNILELHKFGINNQSIVDYIHLLSLQPLVLKNRLQICQEIGCPLTKTPAIVLNFQKFHQARTPLLRAYGVLPDKTLEGLVVRLLGYLDMKSDDCAERITFKYRMIDIYEALYDAYLFRIMPALKDVPPSIPPKEKRERITSMQNFCQNVKFVTQVLKFNLEEMVKFRSILYNDSANMMLLLQSSHGIRIKDLIPEYPELMNVLKDRYDAVYSVIKNTKIDFNTFIKHPDHFHMTFKEFEYHFTNCTTSPFLSVFKYHDRFPELIQRSRIANERINILRHMNMKCYNLNILVGDTNKFLNFVSDGVDKVNPSDTFVMVSKELDKPLDEVKEQLKKNRFIEYISIANVKSNLDYLRELGFEDDDIYRNIQLILYPKEVIHDNVMKIHLGEFTISVGEDKLTIDRKYFLSLALYNIEKEHDFSGSYMWNSSTKIENVGRDTLAFLEA